MENFSGLLVMLMLTGSFAPSKPFSGTECFERPNESANTEDVITMKGESFHRMVFCTEEGDKIWCKGELLYECDFQVPPNLLGSGWKHLTADPRQKVVLKDSSNGCISINMSALQVEDSGTYWFGILYNQKVVPVKKIRLMVLEGQQNGTMTTTSENEQRVYHVLLVLGSTAVGIIIIAIIVLIVMMLIKRKMKGADGLNFGDNPNCRIITLQIRGSNIINCSLSKEMNTVYAILKKPKSKTEDTTYVNTNFPLRSNIIRHSDDPTGIQSSSGSVEYATIIFGSNIPEINDNRTLTS